MRGDDTSEGPDPEVVFQNPRRYRYLELDTLRSWATRVVKEEVPEAGSLVVRLLSDEEMVLLNARFRGQAKTTDVLSFPGAPSVEGWHLGDIAISIPTARRQAERNASSATLELKRLFLHGVLHCLGHDHEQDSGEMLAMERRWRRRWIQDHD